MRDKETILNELRSVENHLSPENLCCDGEAPRSWVIKEGRRLNTLKAKLIQELGYEPGYKELYNL